MRVQAALAGFLCAATTGALATLAIPAMAASAQASTAEHGRLPAAWVVAQAENAQPVSSAPASAPPPGSSLSPPPGVSPPATPTRYQVGAGQSLSDVSSQIAQTVEGVSSDEVAAALYRANPRAFINEDPNLLAQGVTLVVPHDLRGGSLREVIRQRAAERAAAQAAAASAASAADAASAASAASAAAAAAEAAQQAEAAAQAEPQPVVGPAAALSGSVHNTEPTAQVALPALALALFALLIVWMLGRRASAARRRVKAAAPDPSNDELTPIPDDEAGLLAALRDAASRRERTRFEVLAHALWDRTDGEGESWREVASLGRGLDADHPLYSDDPYAAYARRAAQTPRTPAPPLPPLDLSLPSDGHDEAQPAPMAESPVTPELSAARHDAVDATAPIVSPAATSGAAAARAKPIDFDFNLDLDPSLPASPSSGAAKGAASASPAKADPPVPGTRPPGPARGTES